MPSVQQPRQDISESYRRCTELARRAASNFYYTFYLLPHAQRMAMCAVYAYLRYLDDLADAPTEALPSTDSLSATSELDSNFFNEHYDIANVASDKLVRLQRIQTAHDEFQAALTGEPVGSILPALVDTIHKFAIPSDYFVEVMRGMAMDQTVTHYETWSDLKKYCYRAASVVGLICLHIWGVKDERAREPAIQCGYAFQLTNILRDVGEDAAAGRIYLPNADLQKFNYSRDDLFAKLVNENFCSLVSFEVQQAENFFDRGAELKQYLLYDSQRMFAAMFQTYRELLRMIRRNPEQLFTRRMRINRWRKAYIASRALLLGKNSI